MSAHSSLDQLRLAILQQRQQLDTNTQQLVAEKIAERFIASDLLRPIKSLSAFLAVNGEINPSYITDYALSKGIAVYMPIVQDHFKILFAPYNNESKLVLNRYKMPEPVYRSGDLITAAELDLVLTPLLAFDLQGHRLGMGAGYYDRALAIRKTETSPLLIGLAYEFQKQETLIPKPWDIPMDMILTERNLYHCNPDLRRD